MTAKSMCRKICCKLSAGVEGSDLIMFFLSIRGVPGLELLYMEQYVMEKAQLAKSIINNPSKFSMWKLLDEV